MALRRQEPCCAHSQSADTLASVLLRKCYMRRALCVTIVTASAAMWGCGSSKAPTAPATSTQPTEGVAITGSERLGWMQPAASATEAAALGYRLRVDDSTNELSVSRVVPGPAAAL